MNILFICTGNIFRSMTAEYALRATEALPAGTVVQSAGLIDAPHDVLGFVSAHLARHDLNTSGHVPRKLTAAMIERSDLAIAMDIDHQAHVADAYGRKIPLFSRVAFGTDEPMRDVWEVLPNWRTTDPDAGRTYACALIDRIIEGMPLLVERLDMFVEGR